MTIKTIDIVLDNSNRYSISLKENSVANSLCTMLKHLTRLPLRFGALDNPYTLNRDLVIEQITKISDELSLPLDQMQLVDQQYLNHLHTYFENRADDKPLWQMYNEAIHLFEVFNRGTQKEKKLSLDYGSKAGPLARPFQYQECNNIQTQFGAGDCFVDFNELGKTPYQYWRDYEADDVNRLCQLAKPMLRLNFKIMVALEDIDLGPKDSEIFEQWFAPYRKQWCQHWQLNNWTVAQMQGGILIGRIHNIKSFKEDMQTGAIPSRLCI